VQETKSTDFKQQYVQPEWLAVFSCILMFVGFVASRAFISIGMIGLVVAAVWRIGFIDLFKHYFQRKELWVLSFFFVPVFYSGLYSANIEPWLNWVRIKLPYLVLPLAFAGLTQLTKKHITIILYSFLVMMLTSLIVVLANYALHFEAVTNSMLLGNAIAMPFSHIRYTLMLAFSFFLALYLSEEKERQLNHWLIASAVFLFIALHILAVRSGLLALYVGLLVYLIRWIILSKKYGLGFLFVATIAALPVLAYWLVPSFQNKIAHSIYDLQANESRGDQLSL
jgi:O-antigen ligase